MKLRELKKIINNILLYENYSLISNEINKVFDIINADVEKDLNIIIKDVYKKYNNIYNLNLDISLKDLSRIKNKKIKGKNIFERLLRDKKRLLKIFKQHNILKSSEKDNMLKKIVDSEFYRIKRIVNTDSHRITEQTKDLWFNKAKNIKNIEKIWKCSFKNSRDAHKKMHGQIADEEGYFYTSKGEKTKYPGGFGIASLDCNCNCKVEIRII